MSDGKWENINLWWGIACAVIGALASMIKGAFTAGGRNATLVTEDVLDDRLDHFVTKEAFHEFKDDMKADLKEIKKELRDERKANVDRHRDVMSGLSGRQ